MITNFVFIGFGTLTSVLYDALCIKYFQQNGVNIVYADISKLFNFEVHQNTKYDFIVTISNHQEFENLIINNVNKNTLFNIQVGYEKRFHFVFETISKYGCLTTTFLIGYLPNLSKKQRLIKYCTNLPILYNKLKESLFTEKKRNPIKYDICFVAGEVANKEAQGLSQRIVKINYIDYEYNSLYVNKRIKNKNKPYFVYLDINLFAHEDRQFTYIGSEYGFEKEKFLNSLNNFFSFLEEKFQVEVIIAAHPKSQYNNNEFLNRKIIKNNTAELVYHCNAVISHHSTSISFPVINGKPILFIYNNDIKCFYQNIFFYTETFSNYLNMPLINIETNNLLKLPEVNYEFYDRYKYNFLTLPETQNLNNKTIIERFLR